LYQLRLLNHVQDRLRGDIHLTFKMTQLLTKDGYHLKSWFSSRLTSNPQKHYKILHWSDY